MKYVYRKANWTKSDYENFKKELNALNVKISPNKGFCSSIFKEVINVRTINDSLKAVNIFNKYNVEAMPLI